MYRASVFTPETKNFNIKLNKMKKNNKKPEVD